MSERRDPKGDPAATWERLEKLAVKEEAERVAGLSDAELDADLASRGHDPQAVRARGAALAARLMQDRGKAFGSVMAPVAPAPQRVPEPRRRRRPVVVLLAAAVLVAAAGALAYVELRQPSSPPHVPTLPPPPAPAPAPGPLLVSAAELRASGLAACKDLRWADCVADLDRARELDPAGDSGPEVVAARRRAKEATSTGPK
jgi:hypothetical protein